MVHVPILGLHEEVPLPVHLQQTLVQETRRIPQEEVQARFTDNLHGVVQALETLTERLPIPETLPTHQAEALVQIPADPFQDHLEVAEAAQEQGRLQVAVEEDDNPNPNFKETKCS